MRYLFPLFFLCCSSCSARQLPIPEEARTAMAAYTRMLDACTVRLSTPGAGTCGRLPDAPVTGTVAVNASFTATPAELKPFLDVAKDVGGAILPLAIGAATGNAAR